MKKRHARKGRLDVRRTVRASLSTGGVPFDTRFKHRTVQPFMLPTCEVRILHRQLGQRRRPPGADRLVERCQLPYEDPLRPAIGDDVVHCNDHLTIVRAELDYADTRRGIELEVRQAYSDYLQALELLEAQKKTVEQAEESLRLAEARFRAGTGTQLDVLSAQTALTDARSNEIQALYDYNVAVATLERVTGNTARVAP